MFNSPVNVIKCIDLIQVVNGFNRVAVFWVMNSCQQTTQSDRIEWMNNT